MTLALIALDLLLAKACSGCWKAVEVMASRGEMIEIKHDKNEMGDHISVLGSRSYN